MARPLNYDLVIDALISVLIVVILAMAAWGKMTYDDNDSETNSDRPCYCKDT